MSGMRTGSGSDGWDSCCSVIFWIIFVPLMIVGVAIGVIMIGVVISFFALAISIGFQEGGIVGGLIGIVVAIAILGWLFGSPSAAGILVLFKK